MDKNRKKQSKRYIAWGCAALLVFLLAVMPMLASGQELSDGPEASILSAAAERRDIAAQIIGGGQLASEAAIQLKIPENVKLTEYLVGNGDTVSQGDAIAAVDKVSVMTAITQVQETLDYLSGEIADISGEEASDTVKALAGGTVKLLYAQEGASVQDIMLEHGALAVLSLDGLMAVQVERSTRLEAGDTVCVTLSDGSETDGRVKSNLDGVLTVTVEDDGYAVGERVTLTTEDGSRLGSGELYIYSQWNAVAYSGTVSDILVAEGDSVKAGKTLMELEDPGHTAEYQRLIDQRQEYEELMGELFGMYRTETITAPCDGIVTGVDEDGAYLLSDSGSGWLADLLASITGAEEGFTAYAAQVAEVREQGMVLNMDPSGYVIHDLADLPGVSADTAAMSEVWRCTGDTTVYTQGEDGLLRTAGTAKAGQLLLAIGDAERVYWFVALDGADAEESRGDGVRVSLLSAVEETTEPSETTPPSEETMPPEETAPSEPAEPENTVYFGYIAQVVEVRENTMKVKQTAYSYKITDLQDLPAVTVDTEDMTEEETYTGPLINAGEIAAGDILLLVVDEDGELRLLTQPKEAPGGKPGEGSQTERDNASGSMPSGGSVSGFSGGTVQQTFELYSLETLTVASVTSQEHMTVEITIDELDISKLYVGQEAAVTVDALAGEQFAAAVTEIANSGENAGGNSKFAVTLTLAKSGGMLPGMSASAFITVDTAGDVLCIPVSALEETGAKTVVYTSLDEKSGTPGTPVAVTTGTSDGEYVEILEGLTEGQTVYYAYYDTLVISNVPDRGGLFSGR